MDALERDNTKVPSRKTAKNYYVLFQSQNPPSTKRLAGCLTCSLVFQSWHFIYGLHICLYAGNILAIDQQRSDSRNVWESHKSGKAATVTANIPLRTRWEVKATGRIHQINASIDNVLTVFVFVRDSQQLGPAQGSWAVVRSESWHPFRIKDETETRNTNNIMHFLRLKCFTGDEWIKEPICF